MPHSNEMYERVRPAWQCRFKNCKNERTEDTEYCPKHKHWHQWDWCVCKEPELDRMRVCAKCGRKNYE